MIAAGSIRGVGLCAVTLALLAPGPAAPGAPTEQRCGQPESVAVARALDAIATSGSSAEVLLRSAIANHKAAAETSLVSRLEAARCALEDGLAVCLAARGTARKCRRRVEGAGQFYLGVTSAALGDTRAATVAYLAADAVNPGRAAVFENLGALAASSFDFSAAAGFYGRAAACEPRNARHRVNSGKMLYRAGKPSAGASHFADAIALAPADAAARYELARANELYSEWPLVYAATNFSKSLALAWNVVVAAASATTAALPELVPRWRWSAAAQQLAANGGEHSAVAWERTISHSGSGNLSSKAVVIAELRDVEVRGSAGLIVVAGRMVFLPSYEAQIPLHRNVGGVSAPFDLSLQSQPEQRIEAAILLVQLFSVGYYHWLLELVPRLLIARAAAPSAPVLVSSDGPRLHRFMSATLSLLRIPSSAVFSADIGGGKARGGVPRIKVTRPCAHSPRSLDVCTFKGRARVPRCATTFWRETTATKLGHPPVMRFVCGPERYGGSSQLIGFRTATLAVEMPTASSSIRSGWLRRTTRRATH